MAVRASLPWLLVHSASMSMLSSPASASVSRSSPPPSPSCRLGPATASVSRSGTTCFETVKLDATNNNNYLKPVVLTIM